jgi:pilus assembly protein CpaF
VSLRERLERRNAAPGGAVEPTSAEDGHDRVFRAPAQPDPLLDLKRQLQQSILEGFGARLFDESITTEELRTQIVREIERILETDQHSLSRPERCNLAAVVADDLVGFGPLEAYLHDVDVSEIMVNTHTCIYVERGGNLFETRSEFASDEHLRRVIDRIVSAVGRRVDQASPMADARLADGSRVNVILPPLAIDGPILTIRKFRQRSFDLDDLTRVGTITADVADFLSLCVRGRLNMIVSGGTGSGKTTLLNALSGIIPECDRIVTIEDAAELQLQQRHVVRLESRPPNIEGRGEINSRDLLRNALRMRPDRIIIGEVRGPEALDMLQAMNTGHDGSLSTVHANSPRDALARLETMVMTAGFEMPVRVIREHMAAALDVVVQIARTRDGRRRVQRICEVLGMEGDVIVTSEIFALEFSGDDDVGQLRSTGVRAHFTERLSEMGVDVSAAIFAGSHR